MMTRDLRELADAESLVVADVEAIFDSPARTEPEAANPPRGKLAGAGDSLRKQRTDFKPPGGRDASRAQNAG
ncbi:MAG: hypothetical protein QOH04_1646 [Sphingomonadales bacterium]|jgi:hypothetical protein|nr:hypothetical protein [Sphingomonadales bacterium]